MEMMAVWAAVLIVYGVFPGIAAQPEGASANTVLPLDMAENSVDDMYSTCRDQMSNVVNEYLMNEKNTNNNFKQVWDEAANSRIPKARLTAEQILAIRVFTSGAGNFHEVFNAAVRSQRPQYKTTFGYHALHFYLTTAVQTLKDIQNQRAETEDEKCVTGYRRVDRYFSQNVLNREIRLGSFASTSKGRYINAERFGDKSCFKIVTCAGAEITNFSKFKESEGEVLIPPYEVFKVTSVERRSENKNLPCDVVYKLKHTRVLSYLDCALFKS